MHTYSEEKIIFKSTSSTILSAERDDGLKVILKVINDTYRLKEEACLFHEYKILNSIHSEGVIKAFGVERINDRPVLVLEGFDGLSLANILPTHQFSLEELIILSIQLAHTLGEIHSQGIIHKDIKTGNILYNAAHKQSKIIDFGISSFLSREEIEKEDLASIEGTIEYISPEQTGRTNRAIDHRSDIYSLGVVLYELFTSRLPFKEKDELDLIHAHIAKEPVPPYLISEKISKSISDVIMKCLSKDPEERYFSAFGLQSDLSHCLDILNKKDTLANFIPGQKDFHTQFRIPQKLYGREEDLAGLLDIFENVSEGHTQLILASGYAGVGKTKLILELKVPVIKKKGYFLNGKFDQFTKAVPFRAFLIAFKSFIDEIMSLNEVQLNEWKEKFSLAFENNAYLISEVLPNFKLLIHEPSIPRPSQDPQETETKLLAALVNFIKTIVSTKVPLVIFLDDLQWADASSLKLLNVLMMDQSIQYLLMVCSYRSNELDSSPFLKAAIADLQGKSKQIKILEIAPLSLTSVNQFIKASLAASSEAVMPLNRLIYQKTQGNPFFIIQFLTRLEQKRLITFSAQTLQWEYDLQEIEKLQVTDNVAELLSQKIKELPLETQHCLKIGSMIGNTFDLFLLSKIMNCKPSYIGESLWPASKEQLLISYKENIELVDQVPDDELKKYVYKFPHDHLQQAAYELSNKDERPALHVAIGKALLKEESNIGETLITITDHINLGFDAIFDEQEKYESAKLNLEAGRKALNSAAYVNAVEYLTSGIRFLGPGLWEKNHDLAYRLHELLATAQNWTKQHEAEESTLDLLLEKAITIEEKTKAYSAKFTFFFDRKEFPKALQLAIGALQQLGVELSLNPPLEFVEAQIKKALAKLDEVKIDNLSKLPQATDDVSFLIGAIYESLVFPAYVGRSYLSPLIAANFMNMILEKGLTKNSPMGFVLFAWVMGSELVKEHAMAYKLGFKAFEMAKEAGDPAMTARVQFFYLAYCSYWGQPFSETAGQLKDLTAKLAETQLKTTTMGCFVYIPYYQMLMGKSLQQTLGAVETLLDISILYNSPVVYVHNVILRDCIYSLQGKEFTKDDSYYARMDDHDRWRAYDASRGLYYFIQGRFQEAYTYFKEVADFSLISCRHPIWTLTKFYYALTIARMLIEEQEKGLPINQELLLTYKELCSGIKKWAYACPANFLHYDLLLTAQQQELEGDKEKSRYTYEKAIEEAEKHDFVRETAIGSEYLGKLYLGDERLSIASYFIQQAVLRFSFWGAEQKARDLAHQHHDLQQKSFKFLPELEEANHNHTTRSLRSSTFGAHDFDVISLIQASQIIMGEINLDRLIEKMMKVLMTNAGATKICLILKERNNPYLRAKKTLNEEEPCFLNIPLEEAGQQISFSSVNYVLRTGKKFSLSDPSEFRNLDDPYIKNHAPTSILCLPLINLGKVIGVLYFEHESLMRVFQPQRVKILELLASQIAISLENAQFYLELEQKVNDRTIQLNIKNEELEKALTTLKNTQKLLVQHEKLASLGMLTSGIAHEIKNPLNFIINFSEIIEDALHEIKINLSNLAEEYKEKTFGDLNQVQNYLKQIKSFGLRINSIIERMIAHSKPRTGVTFEKINIPQLLNQALEAYPRFKIKNSAFEAKITTKIEPDLPAVEAVLIDLHDVIVNILENAFYATYKKQKFLGAANYMPQIEISVQTNEDKSEVIINIEDNGPGISQNNLSKIFQPFFTDKPAGEGAGLGLSISYDIITQEMNGRMTVESDGSSYTRFSIILLTLIKV